MPKNTKSNGSKNKKNNNKTRNNNNKNFDSKPKKVVEEVHAITYTDGITVGELAEKIAHPSTDIIKTLFMEGKAVTINTPLDDETVEKKEKKIHWKWKKLLIQIFLKNVHLLLQSWDMLTMVKQHFWIRSVSLR